jgi:hypothetical protein
MQSQYMVPTCIQGTLVWALLPQLIVSVTVFSSRIECTVGRIRARSLTQNKDARNHPACASNLVVLCLEGPLVHYHFQHALQSHTGIRK